MISLVRLFIIITCLRAASSSIGPSFNYEKSHNYGVGKKLVENYRRVAAEQSLPLFRNLYEYPLPLPSSPAALVSASTSLYQGARRRGDQRVFSRNFDYNATTVGHQMVCNGFVNCTITHMAVETRGGLPRILRGGVGYQHFLVVARAKPGVKLNGRVRVYCLKTEKP